MAASQNSIWSRSQRLLLAACSTRTRPAWSASCSSEMVSMSALCSATRRSRVAAQERREQLALRGEVGVDRALRVAGRLGDRLERGAVIAEPVEHLGGGVEQPLAGLLAALLARHALDPRLRP